MKQIDGAWVRSKIPQRLPDSHKGNYGSVLIYAGSETMPGAAVLAALGALRSGAGLVTVAASPSVCHAVACQLPEVMILPLPHAIDLDRYDGAVFGPGLSQDPLVRDRLTEVWKVWKKPCVIDADALNLIASDLEPPSAPTVFTPHPGEMARLLQISREHVQKDRLKAVEEASEKFGTALLKGHRTLIAAPGKETLENHTGNPGMATGGMGDVLSGIIGTLLAQQLPTFEAAACGVYWHGAAGDWCAKEIGPVGFKASELADALPRILSI